MSYNRDYRRGYDRRDDRRGYNNYDRGDRSYDNRGRRDRGGDRYGGDRRDRGGRRRGGYRGGRGGRRGGRGGRAAKTVIRYHTDHHQDLITETTDRIGKAKIEMRPVITFRDPKGLEWEERVKIKSGSSYWQECDSNNNATSKPEGLTEIRTHQEMYCPHLPAISKWPRSSQCSAVTVNCFPTEIGVSLFRYDLLGLEADERSVIQCRRKMYPRGMKNRLRRRWCSEQFGDDFIICDGFVIGTRDTGGALDWSDQTDEGDEYLIQFTAPNQVVFADFGETANPGAEMMMLTYVLNECAHSAGFKRDTVSGNRGTVFWKHDESEAQTVRQQGNNWSKPDVRLWRVHEASLKVGYDPDQQQKKLFLNVDCFHKHLCAVSLREIIDDMKTREDMSTTELGERCNQKFKRKRALISYSGEWVQIEELDFENDENYEFQHNSLGSISIKNYLQDQKHLDGEIQRERCIVVCRVGQRRKQCHYLPQHIYVSLTKEQTTGCDVQIKQIEAMDPSEKMRVAQNFVKSFDSQDNKFGFRVIQKPLKLQGYTVPEIKLGLITRSGESWLEPFQFKNEWRSVSGFWNDRDIGQIEIVVVGEGRSNTNAAADSIAQYCRKRSINNYSIVEVIDLERFTEKELDDSLSRCPQGCVVLGILNNDGRTGSAEKATLSRVAARYNQKTQCIKIANVHNRNGFMGMMDDLMAKAGGEWFRIDYGLENFDPSDIWVLGMDVYKSTNENQLSAFNIHLCTDITKGTLTTFERCSGPLAPKETIVPFQILKYAMEDLFAKIDAKNLTKPKYLLIFRSGVSISQMELLRTNEITAMIQSVYSKWRKKRPKLSFFIVPRGSKIRFETRTPVCVADTITGGFFQDFYTQINTRARKTPRVVRYCLVYEDSKGLFTTTMDRQNSSDFLKLLRGLCHLYPQSINFMNGCCSYPGPLKMAQNHAENFTQYVTGDDTSMSQTECLPDSMTNLIKAVKSMKMDVENDRMQLESR